MLLNKEYSSSKHHVFLRSDENAQLRWSRADSVVQCWRTRDTQVFLIASERDGNIFDPKFLVSELDCC